MPRFASVTPTRAQQAVASNTHIFGPTAVNELRLSFMRMSTSTNQPLHGRGLTLSSLGFTENTGLGIFQAYPQYEGVPSLFFNNFSVGNAPNRFTPDNTWQIADNFSKIYGRHNLKFGGDFRYIQVNDRNHSSALNGNFTFDGSETGNDFADFLLGAPASFVQESIQFLDSRTKYGAAYAQDSFPFPAEFNHQPGTAVGSQHALVRH